MQMSLVQHNILENQRIIEREAGFFKMSYRDFSDYVTEVFRNLDPG